MGRNDEIQIPSFVNCAKPEKKGLSEIEKEKLAEMVKAMSFEEKAFLVHFIESDILIYEIQSQLNKYKSRVRCAKFALDEDF